MSSRKWYIQYNDSVLGPFSSNQLRRMAERSQITPNVKVRVGENGNWRLASAVKGLFPDNVSTSDSMSSELSSDDIPISSTDNSSSLSGELSSESFEASDLEQTKSTSFGEMRSEAPPVPEDVSFHGDVHSHGEIPVRREVPPPFVPSAGSFGEMPSPPPPVGSNGFDWPPPSSGRTERNNQSHNSIPSLIQALIGADEQILYAAHPEFIVLFIQEGLTLLIYFLLGILPSTILYSNGITETGGSWLVYSTLALVILLIVYYVGWIRSSYVITTQRTFVKSGIFSVEVGYIYNANIQMLKIRTGFIDKILHLNTIELRTAAGSLSLRWTPLTKVLQFYRKQNT